MDGGPSERPDFLPPGFGTVGHRDFVEIVVPEPVSLVPQTVGWFALVALLLAAVLFLAWRQVRRYLGNAYRRAALGELALLRKRLAIEREKALPALPLLLKRCALGAFPRERVASLSGDDWFAFLGRTGPEFGANVKRDLTLLVVASASEVPAQHDQELFLAVEAWLREHRA